MKFSKHVIEFDLPASEALIDAQLQEADGSFHIIGLTNTGRVLRQSQHGNQLQELGDVSTYLNLDEATRVYCYGCYIALVNNRNVKGVVINVEDREWCLPLNREDYHAEVCSFPIAFFTHADATHLLHGTDWNRLDITNLQSGQCVTERTISYDPKINYFDYFHGLLHMSPDEQHFVSTGWHWHPVDWIYAWNVGRFMHTYEIGSTDLRRPGERDDYGCVWDRPVCFIDDATVAYGHNVHEGERQNDATPPSQLVILDVKTGRVSERIKFDYFAFATELHEIKGSLHFDRQAEQFITFSDAHDLVITNRAGKLIGQDACRPIACLPSASAALSINGSMIELTTW